MLKEPTTKKDQLDELIDSLMLILGDSDKYSNDFCNEINEVVYHLKAARLKLSDLAKVVYMKETP